jgi:N-acetylmuramoyl-L-alanine amidase
MASQLKSVALAAIALSACVTAPVSAQTMFAKAELDPSRIVAIASPYAGGSAHQLLIVEQLNSSRACWAESQSNRLTVIEPLLLQFDFTGICGRSIDSNGYSVRMGDEDLGWKYSLRLVKRNGDMQLVGQPTVDRSLPELQIGRVNGITNGFAKINLNPGWRMTKRTFNGQNVGHIYLTNDQSLSSAIAARPVNPPVTNSPGVRPPIVTLPRPTQPSVPIAVPRPGTTAPKPIVTLPKPPVVNQPPFSTPPVFRPTRPIAPGDFVVPTIDIWR